RQPITLSYAEQVGGPWRTIAANIENTGSFEWHPPTTGAAGRFLVRVEAIDDAGNVGVAQTPRPVLLDGSRPSVSILNVEGGNNRGARRAGSVSDRGK